MHGERRGVVYLGVLIVSVIGFIGGVVYYSMMQTGRRQAYRSLTGEYAAMMARGGLSIAQGYLARELRDPESDLYLALTKPLSAYAGSSAPVEIGGPVRLDEELPALTEALARDLPDGRNGLSRLEARFFLLPAELAELPPLKLGGKVVRRGEQEKWGRLHVEVTAEIGMAILSRGVERTLRAVQEFRVAHGPLPVLSEFTLWLKDVPAPSGPEQRTPVNAVETTERGMLPSSTAAMPIVLNNGRAGKQMEMALALDTQLIKDQGHVYLGGDGVVLNLTYSQEETSGDQMVGEDFQFYQVNPNNPDAGRAAVDASAGPRANKHLPSPFWEIRNWDMGVNTLRAGALASEYGDVFAGELEGHRLGSLLKLCGTAPDRVSPTLVMGDVQAGFFRLAVAAAAQNAAGSFDAYFTVLVHQPKNASGFLFAMYQDLLAIVARLLYDDNPKRSGKWAFMRPDISSVLMPFGSGAKEEDYKELCSGWRSRNYNDGLLFLKARNEAANVAGKVSELALPAGLFGSGADRSKMPSELLPPDLASAAGADMGLVTPEDIVPALIAGAHLAVPAGEKLEDFLKDQGMLDAAGVLDLGSVVVCDRPCVLPEITSVKRGGVLMARSFSLTGGIQTGGPLPIEPARRVVLVATRGGITLPAQGVVQASLVAPGGTVAPSGGFHVQGNVVAGSFDFAPLASGTGQARLDYDKALKQRPADARSSGSLLIDWQRRWTRVD